MSGVIVPLHEFLSSWEEADVSEMLSSFCCSRDRDLQNFLRDRAISYEKRDLSRTLLLIDGEHIPG